MSSGSEPNWTQTFGYDRNGNRTSFTQTVGGTTTHDSTPAVSNGVNGTNRFTGTDFEYDKNGNLVGDIDPVTSQPRDFLFNADNKQREVVVNSATVGQYFYDGEGKRVKKIVGGDATVFVYSSGKLIAEYTTTTPPETGHINYTTTDHLGSPRIITNELGQVTSRRDFMPFGEDLFNGVGARTEALKYGNSGDDIKQKFTGYLKDDETKLDFAEARMYENRFGRFTAVDPLLASGKSANPQTFNRYVYTSNNPIGRVDRDGKEWYYAWEKINGRFYATPQWCSGFGCNVKTKWESEVRSTIGRVTTVWRGSLVFHNDFSGGYTALDPFENRQINSFGSALAAPAQVTAWRKQGIINFIAGALNGSSLAISLSGADGLVAETGSEMYAAGQRAGIGGSIASAITGVSIANAVVNQFGKAGLNVLKSVEISAKGGEGVYDLGTTLGKYFGQSKDILTRVDAHFASGGKLSAGELQTAVFYSMPGSTKLQREAYEHYLITEKYGIENLRNVRRPMGGRVELYNSMIEDVIKQFDLPR